MKHCVIMAMDRASVRRTDGQGFLHVDTSPISKANICPYYGREIPGWQELGLDGDTIYRLFRDPAELAKAAATFNNLPLLSEHVPVDADNIPDELIVGSTGSHAAFDGTYLQNSLSVWKRDAIDGISSNRKRELSSAYRYRPIMEAGEHEGVAFDGRMSDIQGNHVAIVFEGRAGPDVIVGDENMLKSRAALLVQGAMTAYLAPKLASGQKVDITVAMDGANAAMFADDKKVKAFAGKIVGLTDGKLAQDQTLDADGIVAVIGAMAFDEANDEIKEPASTKVEKTDAENAAEADAAAAAEKAKNDPPAMDAAAVDARVATAVTAATTAIEAKFAALRTAERETFDLIGEVACDSADAVYKMALDEMGVDLTGVDKSAYGAMFRAMRKTRDDKPAMDANITQHRSDFAKRYPGAVTLKRGV